jgi:hypothetical protein
MVEATAAAWELELGHQKLHHPQMVALSGEYSAWLMMAVRAEHGARDDLPFSLGFFRCFAVVVEQLFCRGSSSHDKNSVYISFTARNRAKPRLTSRGRVSCVELSVRSVVHKVWNLILKYCLAKKTHRGL